MKIARSGHAIVYFNNEIYVIGGFSHQDFTDSCEKYSIQKNSWQVIINKFIKFNCYYIIK